MRCIDEDQAILRIADISRMYDAERGAAYGVKKLFGPRYEMHTEEKTKTAAKSVKRQQKPKQQHLQKQRKQKKP